MSALLSTSRGPHTVRLTVSNEAGSDSAEVTITALPPPTPPVAAFTTNPDPPSGPAPLTVQFTNQSTGENLSYLWDFGDGTDSDSNDAILVYQYAQPGNYTVRLTVTDQEQNLSDSAEIVVQVSEEVVTLPPLAAGFDATEISPLTFSFVANAEGGDGSYVFTWDFGDGSGASRVHRYNTFMPHREPIMLL
ncbi:PKD domain-containing protein [bacterium]|nr:PKD domain-containing protein [bacterium]